MEADRRIPVYAVWPEEVGPLLSLGMLTAAARCWHGGELEEQFEIRRPETLASCLADLAGREGPAVLLCSNYVWSLEHNLAGAVSARALNPDLVVIHGGPSTPKYPDDAEGFLRQHSGIADILVRGEGEDAICLVLSALAAADGQVESGRLAEIAGLTLLDESGGLLRTPDTGRIADLTELPSPYLTGEFDGLPADAWKYTLSIETNRGCPYGCTFCDWGSATMSRIRKFPLDRVVAEFEWAARLGVATVTLTDANFGIMARDVDIVREIARIRTETGAPRSLSWTAAKNTTKHLVKIMDLLSESGVAVSTSLSLQTTDPATLAAIERDNISVDHYVKLAADYRRRGYPLQGDLMLGLPGQTFESYKADLQFMQDHEIMVRTWPTQMLPNSPMNDPDYRRAHALEVGPDNLIVSSATFDAESRRRMWRFRTVDTVADRLGVLRHVQRYLQWDHGVAATDLEERLLDLVDHEPTRFPAIAWLFGYFDLIPTVAGGWRGFYDEVRQFVAEDFDIDPTDSGLETVLQLQLALMPAPGRTFPVSVGLPNDYVDYYRSATHTLYTTGHAGVPDRPLQDYPPATFTVRGDPLGLCSAGIHPAGDARSEIMQGDLHVGAAVANELDSDLIRVLPALSHSGFVVLPDWIEPSVGESDLTTESAPERETSELSGLAVSVVAAPTRGKG